MDYDAIGNGLAAAAGTCTYSGPSGELRPLHAHGFAPETIDPPALEVGEVEIGDDLTFDDDQGAALESPIFTLRLYVARSPGADRGHPLLRHFLAPRGPGSIKAALEVDRTLGGLVDALIVRRRYGYGVYEVAGNHYYGARLDVQVWGRG